MLELGYEDKEREKVGIWTSLLKLWLTILAEGGWVFSDGTVSRIRTPPEAVSLLMGPYTHILS